MMKVNQIFKLFILLLSVTQMNVWAGPVKAIKMGGKAVAFAARIATNRAPQKEQQMFMLVNAGAGLLKFLHGVLEASPQELAREGEPISALQEIGLVIAGSRSMGELFRQAGRDNLEKLVEWYRNKKKLEMESIINADTQAPLYTPEEIEKYGYF